MELRDRLAYISEEEYREWIASCKDQVLGVRITAEALLKELGIDDETTLLRAEYDVRKNIFTFIISTKLSGMYEHVEGQDVQERSLKHLRDINSGRKFLREKYDGQ